MRLDMPTMRTQPPTGIIITQGLEVIQANGGLWRFMHHFTETLNGGSYWLHKSRLAPKEDIAHVYIIIQNKVWGRCFYGGHKPGREGLSVTMRSGEVRPFPYPHMILAGPVERPPKIERVWRGFQGFRYIYEPLW